MALVGRWVSVDGPVHPTRSSLSGMGGWIGVDVNILSDPKGSGVGQRVAAVSQGTRHLTVGACSYANVCEQCDNYVPDPDRRDVLDDQLADVIVLRDDADQRGWTEERTRHEHVAEALNRHLRTIENRHANDPAS